MYVIDHYDMINESLDVPTILHVLIFKVLSLL